jgi:hypothetical protein
MIGLLAKNLLMLNQLALLMQQSPFPGESLPKTDLGAPMFCKLAFIARDCAAPRAFKYRI